ncbi:MAG: ThiF family adenylyltransferase [Burkholderiales bacterium]|jgi:molybdopterin/thiamine biosynthesis adenylyltransferase|nr:ThiF family adenylyltransferase [Burkholderiales bacterium]
MDSDRYLRHNLIDWFSQDEVRAARIAVIGAGAVGNEVVKNLALLGVGAIDVHDFDRVEIHNLTRSIFLRESDIGASKAEAVVARARAVDPRVELHAVDGDFWRTLRLSSLARSSAAVCCVDNFEARLRLNQMCLVAGVDVVNTAIDSRFVTVETFPFAGDAIPACFECHLPHSAYQRIAERYSCGWLRKTAYAERKIPTTTITASIAGALAASAALRLGNARDHTARRIFFDTLRGVSTVTTLDRQSECAGCGTFARRPRVIAAGNDWARRLSEATGIDAASSDSVLRLSDALITDYECASCGDTSGAASHVGRRAADFDDRITLCAACGVRAVRVGIREEFTAEALVARFDRVPPPVKYALADVGGAWICLDFEEEG